MADVTYDRVSKKVRTVNYDSDIFQARRTFEDRPMRYFSLKLMNVKLREQIVMNRISAKE